MTIESWVLSFDDLLKPGVIQMIKFDILTGLLIGVVLGLVFTPQLTPHLAVIVILTVLFGGRMIHVK